MNGFWLDGIWLNEVWVDEVWLNEVWLAEVWLAEVWVWIAKFSTFTAIIIVENVENLRFIRVPLWKYASYLVCQDVFKDEFTSLSSGISSYIGFL